MIRNKKVFNNLHKMIPQWTWQEIKYGLEKRLISFDEVREYAIDNSNTGLGSYVDYNGNYIGGWRLSTNQIHYHETNGYKLH